ncbi:hypothetical protein AEYBE204_10330 [Asticcacaulis sp. YBE204]|nr:hypothetical protein AEYBE204_10330 [Asticcacaulis sp. YBE204]
MFGVPVIAPVAPTRKTRPAPRADAPKVLDEEDMARRLEESGRYRVLRKLAPRPVAVEPRPGFPFIGVIVDTETTGLSKTEHEIIEIGAIAFRYDGQGNVGDIIEVYGGLQAPSKPIPAEITVLTGITDDMVKDQHIDMFALESLIGPADLVIAHNAAFDRPFCERLSSIFASKAWACSNAEIDWKARGFEGSKLAYLIHQSGYFHEGHRAVDDCFALFEVLLQPTPQGKTPFAELCKSSQRERVKIWAEFSPFDRKDALKARGYRWSAGEGSEPKAWWTEVDAEAVEAELHYLETEIYNRSDINLTTRRLSAVDRFKT